jgi:hypothetical protein
MPTDFLSQRIDFPLAPAPGGQRTATRDFDFPSDIISAESFINGFNIGFDNDEHPILRMEINTRADRPVNLNRRVRVFAVFSIRDNSGNFDDPYSGFIDVVVVVNRV